MSLAGSMKWHIVRYPQKPGNQLVMGSVLKRHHEPDSSLFRERDVIPIPEDDKQDQSDSLRTAIQSQQSKTSDYTIGALLPLSALLSAGASAGATTNRHNETVVNMAGVRATIFHPTHEYMTEVLQKPEVIDYVRKGLFSKSLYIIVGVAIASKVDLHEARSKDQNRGLSLRASVPEVGVDGAISASHSGVSMVSSSVSVETDVAFAYCVKEFEYSRIRKKFKDKGHVIPGSLMSCENTGGYSHEDNCVDADLPKFEWFIDEDLEDEEDGSITITVIT